MITPAQDQAFKELSKLYLVAHLSSLGCQIEQTNPIFDELFNLYASGELYREVQTEWLPVLVWNPVAKALLEPYKRIAL